MSICNGCNILNIRPNMTDKDVEWFCDRCITLAEESGEFDDVWENTPFEDKWGY